MIKNYFKIAWRNLIKNKGYSFINIGGLAIGMTVVMLISLWIYDELSFDKYHKNYDHIAQVMQNFTSNSEIRTGTDVPPVMAQEIRNKYGSDFKYVLQASYNTDHTLTYGEKMFIKPGTFWEPQAAEMLSLKMIRGTRDGLKDPHTILLSRTIAEIYFGKEDPINKTIKIDNRQDVKVAGVYEDLPDNTTFRDMNFILPWDLYLILNPWVKELENPWSNNMARTFVQIADNADMNRVSAKIRDVKLNNISNEEKKYDPVVFLFPMSKWHLYSDFKNGVITGGRIEIVWLFGIIGIFVLLLACINFMNLSTARSEKRAKEVGIRKVVGSLRKQLIAQFFSESTLTAALALSFAILFVGLALPYFNTIADKKMIIPWSHPVFWLTITGFTITTGLIAGLYPALFLSSFQPIKVLKGSIKVGRNASLPRKILVVMQFTISVMLIVGTIVVFRQINHAKDRPIGYNKNGLVRIPGYTVINWKFDAVRNELKNSGAILEMAGSGSPTTEAGSSNGAFNWEGKDPNLAVNFPNNEVSYEYGKTIGWQIVQGRDFSREYATDSAAFILNESAAKYIGLSDPVGKTIYWGNHPFTIIGIVKNLLVESPYEPVRPSLFRLSTNFQFFFLLRINPSWSANKAITKIEEIFKRNNPASPFKYSFVDEDFARKFGAEERIGKLALNFALLAIFISCLGLFGLASFVAEQRTKEIGIRKVLGASVTGVWQLLSKDFLVLVIISCFIATPAAYYFMHKWLQQFNYRANIPWWLLCGVCIGALVITIMTVSFQAIKAAIANPVKSLRTE
jgi:putative ABC transport system permease protein